MKNSYCPNPRKSAPATLLASLLVAAACLASAHTARAQLGYDPFAATPSHTEERWATYTDATTGGVNRPSSTFINGVNASLVNAASFNFGVTAPSPSGAFITSGGNIYSPTTTLVLAMTSTYAPAAGLFNTVVLSIKTLGNQVDTAGVLLTPNGGTGIAPRYSSTSASGAGMGATAQYAFQFDLSTIGGSNNFTITLPGSASSVSFSSSQLDATTTAFGAQNIVPEPSSLMFVAAAAFGAVSIAAVRNRKQG